jgi:VanZ family protein
MTFRPRLSLIIWLLLAFAVSLGISVPLGALGPSPVWPILLIFCVGTLMGVMPKVAEAPQRLPLILIYGGGFIALWALTNEYIHESPLQTLVQSFGVVLSAGVAVLALVRLTFLNLADRKFRRVSRWMIGSFLFAWVIAYMSSAAGGADPMIAWFSSLGLGQQHAELATLTVRKGIHFLFYGLMAVVAWKAAKVGGATSGGAVSYALGFALLHAVFDELRQTLTPERTGSAWDVLLNMAGALVLLAAIGAFRARAKAAKA